MIRDVVSSLLAIAIGLAPPSNAQTVKVFILAGQSNMVGHGFIEAQEKRNGGKGSLAQVAKQPSIDKKFKRLLNRDGSWRVRDDVWIHYLEKTGRLTVGFGAGPDCIGPELGFGNLVGDALREPVLLIKLAWGGKSLAKDFRPPSSGGAVGAFYTEVVQRSKEALANIDIKFPELKGRTAQLAGFGWHQGWNDRINSEFVQEYEQNMANFIRDIRRDLNTPGLPFVIAETGMGGLAEKNQRALDLMNAQAAVALQAEFRNNVAFVGTRTFWRPAEISPSDQGYHWNSNAETYYLIGDGMGQSMIKLLKQSVK